MNRIIINKFNLRRLLLWFKVVINNHQIATGKRYNNLENKILTTISKLDESGYSDMNVVIRSSKYRDVYKYGIVEFYFGSSEFNTTSFSIEFEDGEENLRRELLRLLDKNSSFGRMEYQEPTFEVFHRVLKTNKGLRVI